MLSKSLRLTNTPRVASIPIREFGNGVMGSKYLKALREETLSNNVKECQYAVRGAIPMRGEEI
jgi:hypothetical protein